MLFRNEKSRWVFEISTLFRSIVESVFRLSDFNLTHRFKVDAFGKILAQQPVGIFVEAPFPRTIGMRKIDVGS